MKNSVKLIVSVALLIAIMAGAVVLYNKLSDEYGGGNLAVSTTAESGSVNTYAAPDFTVLDYDGNEVKLSDFKGKPVVLNVWATWCYYCKEEMPDFNKAYKNYPEVQFLMINATDGVQETMSAAKKYVEDEGFEFDVFFDTKLEAVNNYRITGFPATFFIDEDGNLVTRGNGMLDYDTLVRGIEMILED